MQLIKLTLAAMLPSSFPPVALGRHPPSRPWVEMWALIRLVWMMVLLTYRLHFPNHLPGQYNGRRDLESVAVTQPVDELLYGFSEAGP